MAAHAQAKQRVHTHRGVDFIVVPGSKRERVLLDLFQSEDRLASRAPLTDIEVPGGGWLIPLMVGAVSGACMGLLVGWVI